MHEKMCSDLAKVLPDGYRCMKHLSSGTMMKQAHDGAKCNNIILCTLIAKSIMSIQSYKRK